MSHFSCGLDNVGQCRTGAEYLASRLLQVGKILCVVRHLVPLVSCWEVWVEDSDDGMVFWWLPWTGCESVGTGPSTGLLSLDYKV